MGVVNGIRHNMFPKQGQWLGRRVDVCFDYDTSHQIGGTIVREDIESPGKGIIALDDGRYVLMTECQYSLVSTQNAKSSGPAVNS